MAKQIDGQLSFDFMETFNTKEISIILGRVPRPTYGLDVCECLSSFFGKVQIFLPKKRRNYHI